MHAREPALSWEIVYAKQALKDAEKIKVSPHRAKVKTIITALGDDPFYSPPPYEKLVGDLTGFYSRRINIQHRLVYQVYEREKIIKIIRMWTHYE